MEELLTIAYIYPGDKFLPLAKRFVSTYESYSPNYPHRVVILMNGCEVTPQIRELFYPVTVYFVKHDNSGWDIGAWLAFAKLCEGVMLCLGTSVHCWRSGWLQKLGEAREEHGVGVYGISGSYEKRPHINTTAFMADCQLLRKYPKRVVTWQDRYEFEHGERNFLSLAKEKSLPIKVVTWDGVYDQPDWRKPENIFRRGNQSNLLLKWNHTEVFDRANEKEKGKLAAMADGKSVCV